MTKRSRGVTYLDSIDLEILEQLEKPNYKENIDGHSVLDTSKKLNIKHISLKPHLDKLLRIGFVHTLTTGSENPRLLLLTLPAYNVFVNDAEHLSVKEISDMKKQEEQYRSVIDVMRKIRKMHGEKEVDKLINIDLRKSETQEKYGAVMDTDKKKKNSRKK